MPLQRTAGVPVFSIRSRSGGKKVIGDGLQGPLPGGQGTGTQAQPGLPLPHHGHGDKHRLPIGRLPLSLTFPQLTRHPGLLNRKTPVHSLLKAGGALLFYKLTSKQVHGSLAHVAAHQGAGDT